MKSCSKQELPYILYFLSASLASYVISRRSIIMSYQIIIAIILLALAFAVTFLGNVLLAVMVIKLKRQEEHKTADRKRHFDVLFAALAVSDILGSCLIYPILLHLYHLASQEKKISGHLCDILGSSAVFYFSFVTILTVTMSFHNLFSGIWPFAYYVYLRKKKSKLPFLCVSGSLLVALVSLTLSAKGFSFFNLTSDKYLGTIPCVPQVSYNIFSKSYFFIIAHFFFWTHFVVFVVTLRININTKNTQIAKFGRVTSKTGCLGLPSRAWFQLLFKLIYLICWAPFMVAMTIVTCSSYHIPTDVLVTVCYLLFLPGLVGPFVCYVTHEDLRDVFNTTIISILSRKRPHNEGKNVKDIGINNLNCQSQERETNKQRELQNF